MLLHLFPGALLTALFVLAVPPGARIGMPSFATFLVIGILVLLPFELGVLLWEGRRRNGSFSLAGVVVFRQPLPAWQYPALIIPLLVWTGAMFMLVNPPAESAIIARFFGWLPEQYFVGSFAANMGEYSRAVLVISAVVLVVVNGVVGPVVEELYFRGYLLPRMSWSGGWAPLLNSVLFAVYHFFTPWQTPARIVAYMPAF
ncbi:MAG: CPBP family glutamic-type intramembrane protease, partial [Planctomycetota bacterium]